MNGAGIDTIALLSTDHAWNMIKINDSGITQTVPGMTWMVTADMR